MNRRRAVRQRQILPASFHSGRERREYVVSFGLVAVLQLAIAIALSVSGLQTYRMWKQGVAYLPGDLARFVPVGFAGGAVIALLSGIRTSRRLRQVQSMAVETERDDR